ncbi:MAG: ATPase, T2SS/T4P/T4SS family [Bacteroidota bacterium]
MAEVPFQIPVHLQQRISAEQAHHYRIVPVKEEADTLILKTDTSVLDTLLQELQIVLDDSVSLESCATEELERYLSSNYRIASNTASKALGYTADFLEKVIVQAKTIGSSDIHFEPYEERCRVRFRLDGKLMEYYDIPIKDYPAIINKIKVRARLDIAEKRLPQDGRITLTTPNTEFDIRVSSVPTLYGEKLVLRILSKDAGALQLEDLGFTNEELDTFREGVKRPNGILLISGPTGSGKTTTLYATLKELNQPQTNILTIEDPIEYTLEGINQVQLKENIGLDYSSALRTFLRQDPDIIMVGEIRDVKTANIAIRAALTGHLVLSTIHTNSSWATISRLIDMGVPPFLIASTINLSVAQRLVRKLCPSCKQKVPMESHHYPNLGNSISHIKEHYIPKGCNDCHHTGYKGRKAIYEILAITKALESPIKEGHTEIEEHLNQNRIKTLKINAINLVKQGETSIEEVYSLLL